MDFLNLSSFKQLPLGAIFDWVSLVPLKLFSVFTSAGLVFANIILAHLI